MKWSVPEQISFNSLIDDCQYGFTSLVVHVGSPRIQSLQRDPDSEIAPQKSRCAGLRGPKAHVQKTTSHPSRAPLTVDLAAPVDWLAGWLAACLPAGILTFVGGFMCFAVGLRCAALLVAPALALLVLTLLVRFRLSCGMRPCFNPLRVVTMKISL